jgi:spore photoproduct lyase
MEAIKKVNRKSMLIRYSGRSTDYISPSFGYGCLFECSYCYMKRHQPGKQVSIAKNTGDILTAINNHAVFPDVEKPNQTHKEYITYDISCNEDYALHSKHHDWQRVFTFFRDHPRAMGSFATKTVPVRFLNFDPKKKIRIRFSLMPQIVSSEVEPNTSKIIDRIKAVDAFIEEGYDVHLNFSPVIVYKDWLKDYELLFDMCNDYIENKEQVLSEVIFLTHNKSKHAFNVDNNIPGEQLLWNPLIQESKKSQYGGENIRYKLGYKQQWIAQFKELHDKIIPWNTIRYAF